MPSILQFESFICTISPGFWQRLAAKKLDAFRLNEDAVDIVGFYAAGRAINSEAPSAGDNASSAATAMPARICLNEEAFDVEACVESVQSKSRKECPVLGRLLIFNTLEDFKSADRQALLAALAAEIHAEGETSKLTRFLLLVHADIKRHKFYYQFACPAIVFAERHSELLGISPTTSVYSADQINSLYASDFFKLPFFLIQKNKDTGMLEKVHVDKDTRGIDNNSIFGFVDPAAGEGNPGWPLRNFLTFLSSHFKLATTQIVCLRDRQQTILLRIGLANLNNTTSGYSSVGWERNSAGKIVPNMIDLSSMMDPTQLAKSAAELNLKLIKWRLLPELDLDLFVQTRCLLLGAGTLGCNVSRLLLGWGFKHLTFVDNGKVSYSNPVRQSLFTVADCANGGGNKAEVAAARALQIDPSANIRGEVMSVPMPGHPPMTTTKKSEEEWIGSVERFRELIRTHDVIFLLTDSREGRWAGTLIGAAENKLVITAALGFDSFMVMRHGYRNSNTAPEENQSLSCYFCHDVVAPTDSMSNRTLDQKCTVTRPGLSYMAAAVAVELVASLLQHPRRGMAPATTQTDPMGALPNSGSILGAVPHQIRGYASHLQNAILTGHAFNNCSACSPMILAEYQKDPVGFIQRAVKESDFLERISGLAELRQEVSSIDLQSVSDYCISDDDGSDGAVNSTVSSPVVVTLDD